MNAATMTANSFRAEWLKTWRRPATWILGIILFCVILSFGYFFLYLVSLLIRNTPATAQNPSPDASARLLLEGLLPEHFVSQVLSLVSSLGGPIALILGALALGSEFGWGTLKTVFTQYPSRLTTTAGKLLALALLLLILSVGSLVIGLVGSLVYALLAGESATLPSVATIIEGVGAGWLILAAWTALGVVLATLFRSTALAIGLGLVYALVLETIAGTITTLVERIRPIRQAFLGANSGDLANSFGATTNSGGPLDTSRIGAGQATIVLLVYVVVFLVVTFIVLQRRDVA
ncbi:MAG: ABC transporter permease [Thermomicrobiales bacterium]